MTSRISTSVLALALAFVGPAAIAGSADEPEKLVAAPQGADGADAYWSAERMERATIVRPITLDPITKQPVARAMS